MVRNLERNVCALGVETVTKYKSNAADGVRVAPQLSHFN